MSLHSRRYFIKTFGASAISLPAGMFFFCSLSQAAELPLLNVSSRQARALEYVEETTNPSQSCLNCRLYQGKPGKDSGPCTILPGKAVRAKGWCRSWTKR